MNLEECKAEMRNIISELQDIEWGVRRDFINIGQDLCGNKINKVVQKYEGVSNALSRVSSRDITQVVNTYYEDGVGK